LEKTQGRKIQLAKKKIFEIQTLATQREPVLLPNVETARYTIPHPNRRELRTHTAKTSDARGKGRRKNKVTQVVVQETCHRSAAAMGGEPRGKIEIWVLSELEIEQKKT